MRVLAPYDPPDRLSARLHRGARPEARELPDWLVPLGRTIGVPANGAVSNLRTRRTRSRRCAASCARAASTSSTCTSRSLPCVGYDALDSTRRAARRHLPLLLRERGLQRHRQPDRRPAQAQPPARAHRRLRGRRLDRAGASTAATTASSPTASTCRPSCRRARRASRVRRCASPSSARPSSARACRSCCAPSRRCASTSPPSSSSSAPTPDEVEPLLLDATAASPCSARSPTTSKAAALAAADLLVAPSLGGESFGMVLTEAFAAGTPVVASDIPGYRDVVRDGVDGVLVPRGDATALAETLRDLALDAAAPRGDGRRGRARARHRYAWPPVAGEVLDAYEDAVAMPRARHRARARRRVPRRASRPTSARAGRPRRLPSLEAAARGPRPPPRRRPQGRDRRSPRLAAGFLALLALQRIGIDRIGDSLLRRHADVGPARAGPDVRLDGACAASLARDPARGAARGAPAARRRAAGHVHRRAHVGHAARPPRRALARADRRAPHRPAARATCRPSWARSSRRRCSTSSRW